jgi:UDP:flavonoid glycosyltransferase YjiC (YdhE family)
MSNDICNNDVKTIFIFTYPYTGHCNPIFGVCRRLMEQNVGKFKLIVYGDEKFRNLFEKCGAEFRTYKTPLGDENFSINVNPMVFLLKALSIANKNAKEIYKDVLEAKPSLVLYDKNVLYPKFMIDYFVQQLKKEKRDLFKIIGYSTTLQMDRDYPNELEIKHVKIINLIKMVPRLLLYLKRKREFIRKHKLKNQSYSFLAHWVAYFLYYNPIFYSPSPFKSH